MRLHLVKLLEVSVISVDDAEQFWIMIHPVLRPVVVEALLHLGIVDAAVMSSCKQWWWLTQPSKLTLSVSEAIAIHT